MRARTSLHLVLEVSLPTYPREQMWHTSPFMLSGNFSQGTLILSFSRFSTEVIFRLCCKSPLSRLSASTGGNRKHFKDERRNNKTDNKEFAEMLISSSLCHIRDQLQYPPILSVLSCSSAEWCRVKDFKMSQCQMFVFYAPVLTFAFLFLIKTPTAPCPPPVCAGGKGALD